MWMRYDTLHVFTPHCTYICVFRWADWVNDLSHTLHWYSLSPLCKYICIFRWVDWVNDSSHTLHWYSLSPLWKYMCDLRLTDSLITHFTLIRLLPTVYTQMCLQTTWLTKQFIIHLTLIWFLSAVYFYYYMCLQGGRIWWMIYHTLHIYGFYPLCTSKCLSRLVDWPNALSHTLHW